MAFDQIADKVLAAAVLSLLFDRQVRAGIAIMLGLPLAVILYLTRGYRTWQDRSQGRPWRV